MEELFILKLKVGQRVLKDHSLIKKEIISLFKGLYHQEKVLDVHILADFLPKLEAKEAAQLEVVPTLEKTKEAVWSCDLRKAPRYDGYNVNFIKKMWHVIGPKFSRFVLEVFNFRFSSL